MSEPTEKPVNCFVVIGFGMKTDHSTGRVLNLDKTYQKLIKPALDRVGVRAFRAIDVNRAGGIDEIMYQWLYQADMVIADLSTMNANVFYELGVRHAQKPNTTLVIAEKEMMGRIPFDLSHTVIHSYEHLGEDIAEAEAARFVDHLAATVGHLLENPVDRDSPVYTHLRGMKPPEYVDFEARLAEIEAKRQADAGDVRRQSLAMVVEAAEAAKSRGDFESAAGLFRAALEQSPGDVFLRQRLALVTYKRREKDGDAAAAIAALEEAQGILASCEPDASTDPETLGLAGAIEKRLFERTGDAAHLERSIAFYERGFYVKQDYYNGINVAFLYTLKALRASSDFDAIVFYGHGNLVRRRVADVCRKLMETPTFEARGDREWVVQTLAQAHLGMGEEAEAAALMPRIAELSKGAFDLETFKRQNAQLVEAIETFGRRVRVPGPPAPLVEAPPAPTPRPAQPAAPVVAPAASAAVSRAPDGSIRIDLGKDRERPLRSFEVRVEFA